jgi:hypothetical protein
MTPRYDRVELNDRLRDAALDVAQRLIPAGRRAGTEWHASASKSPLGCAVSVVVSGRKRGTVLITGSGGVASAKGGASLLGLIKEVRGCSWPEAYDIAAGMVGLAPERDESPEQRAERERIAAQRRAEREAEDSAEREDSIAAAAWWWRRAVPGQGTLAEVYLATRGLDTALVTWSETRFIPDMKHFFEPWRGPALVARVKGPDGSGVGVWFIFIRPDGSGKAPVEMTKLGRGVPGGGAVRLGGDAEEIGLGEGYETAQGARELLGCRIPVWAGLSTAGLIGFVPPPFVRRVRIFPDGDKARTFLGGKDKPRPLPPGQVVEPPGRVAARKCAEQLRARGLEVIVEAEPQAETDYLDLLLTMKGRVAC